MYRTNDQEIILKNLDNLEDKALNISMNKYEPTMDERKKVYNEIIHFIKTKKRIVYGGYAQNELIRIKDKKDVFYRDTDMADIEFYTPDPISDMIDMCDMLYSKKFKYVQAKEGVHNETYKIFVNFVNYCDITYLPRDIFNNMPTIKAKDMLMSHPHYMLMDAYRVYTDPMTSYFRLKKTFTRFNTLINHYPFNDNMIFNKIEYMITIDKMKHTKLLHFIRKHIIHNSKLIVVGHYAFNQLMKMAKMPSSYIVDCTFYQLISENYNDSVETITTKLKQQNSNITRKSYYPFSQYFDRSTEWYAGDMLILRLYGTNQRCIVYRYSEKKKTYFGSFQLLILYNLIQYIIGIIRKNKFNEIAYGTMVVRLFKARDTYLEKHNKNVLDKTIFQEFTLECIGTPNDILRSSFLDRALKKEKGKQMTFNYTPTGKPGKKPNFRFTDTSGNVK